MDLFEEKKLLRIFPDFHFTFPLKPNANFFRLVLLFMKIKKSMQLK